MYLFWTHSFHINQSRTSNWHNGRPAFVKVALPQYSSDFTAVINHDIVSPTSNHRDLAVALTQNVAV